LNLALLAYYKYAYFFATVAGLDPDGGAMHWLSKLALPIGISFFTFQGDSYLVDVHRGQVPPERDFFIFGAYLAFFPQLIAGTVVRYDDVKRYLREPLKDSQSFAAGAARFSHGLLKKLLVADTVAVIADAAFGLPNGEVTFAAAALGALAYTLQIYFDFSGYSDMAIGLGLMFQYPLQ
jgi:alginate O-acetyltransferase complex protein AlgI